MATTTNADEEPVEPPKLEPEFPFSAIPFDPAFFGVPFDISEQSE